MIWKNILMKKISTLEQLKWLARSTGGGIMFTTSTAYALDIIGFNLPKEFLTASPVVGISITSFWWLAYQMDLLVYRPRKSTSFAHSVNRITPMDDLDMQTTMIDIPLNEPDEFVFSCSLLPEFLLVDIKLSRLAEFLGAGFRRQRLAVSKTQHRFLISEAWSMKYFTEIRIGPQRFESDEVKSCRVLLAIANKWSKPPKQGYPGRLHQHVIFKSHHGLADDIMTIWKRRMGYRTALSNKWWDKTKRRLKRFV